MELCTWCIARVAIEPHQIQIMVRPPVDQDQEDPFRSWVSTLHDKLAYIHDLIMTNHQIALDGMSEAFVPVSTWHADPICGPHLALAIRHRPGSFYDDLGRSPGRAG